MDITMQAPLNHGPEVSQFEPCIDSVQSWLFDAAWPLWAERGFDFANGGFVERLDLATLQSDIPFKRLRVQARQIYVFSHAHQLGWVGPALERASDGLAFMRKAWIPDRGWARTLSPRGEIVDETLDLYDQAFALFALGWHHRASGDPGSAKLAEDTLIAIHGNLRHPTGRGYMHVSPPTMPWQQNPHMHLLEAMIVLHATTGNRIFAEEARALAELFRDHFYREGTLAEYYDAAWKHAPGAQGRVTEPGHQFEWSWLLSEYYKMSGHDLGQEAKGLHAFADRHGRHATGSLTIDEVRDDGMPLAQSVRLWPQTEALKSNLAMMEQHGIDTRTRCCEIIENLFQYFLDKPLAGLWIDHYESDLATVKTKHIPASSLYHITLAFSEVLRLKNMFLAT